jgi:hypothetical protein
MPPAGGAESNGWRNPASACSVQPTTMPKLPLTLSRFPAAMAILAAVVAWAAAGNQLSAADLQGCLDERSYAVFDALFLQRNNASISRPVVVKSTAPSSAVLGAADPISTIGTGARATYGTYGEEDLGWEVGYLGVYGMHAARAVSDPTGTLQAADPVFAQQTGLIDGFGAWITNDSQINSLEANVVMHEYDGGFNRRSGRPWQRVDWYDGGHVDWLAGFRWANLYDTATLAIPPGTSTTPSTYAAQASSNLFAAQLGTRGRLAFERWAFEGWMKIGIAGTALSQSQSLVDALSPTPFRQPTSSDTAGMGMIADMNLSAIYRLDDVWGLRVGYNLFWLTGVALAADQWDFSANQAGGTALQGTGSVFLNGANLGLEARW